ncbi:hypothetical protein KY358_06880, partial [Candidatus Woesearchaeota archaeon]|nr:hypothetical protein [Candidatus Woesearchaeota archaeon]
HHPTAANRPPPAASGGGGATIVGRTSKMSAGDLGGYAEANNKCTSEFSGSHVCTVNEILNTIITYGDTITSLNGWEEGQSGWIMGGPPGYNAVSVNDCDGFTSDDSLYYGRYWLFVFSVTEPSGPGQLPTTTYYNQGKGMLSSCNSDLPIACCG